MTSLSTLPAELLNLIGAEVPDRTVWEVLAQFPRIWRGSYARLGYTFENRKAARLCALHQSLETMRSWGFLRDVCQLAEIPLSLLYGEEPVSQELPTVPLAVLRELPRHTKLSIIRALRSDVFYRNLNVPRMLVRPRTIPYRFPREYSYPPRPQPVVDIYLK